jgi:hypothetical protein
MRLKWKLVSISFEIVLILMQDRCMACVERTIGSVIVLDPHPMELPDDMGDVESHIGPLKNGVRVSVR